MNILINKDTNLQDVYNQINTESNKKKPAKVTIKIHSAKEIPMNEIEKLGHLITNSDLIVRTESLGDVDFTEFAFLALCNTTTIQIPEGCKIDMSSSKPISNKDLTRIATRISQQISCNVQDIIKYYHTKSLIEPNQILTEISYPDENSIDKFIKTTKQD